MYFFVKKTPCLLTQCKVVAFKSSSVYFRVRSMCICVCNVYMCIGVCIVYVSHVRICVSNTCTINRQHHFPWHVGPDSDHSLTCYATL